MFYDSASEMKSDSDYEQFEDEKIKVLKMDLAQDGEKKPVFHSPN